jgi:uncharacterized membrane protein YbhN (UPF0104 family)
MASAAVVSYVVAGFVTGRNAPPGIHWIIWLFWACFIFPFFFAALLVGRWIRRSSNSPGRVARAAKAHPVEARLLFYALIAVVMVPSSRVWAKATGWSFSHVLLANFAILFLLIAITEIKEHRKRRMAG